MNWRIVLISILFTGTGCACQQRSAPPVSAPIKAESDAAANQLAAKGHFNQAFSYVGSASTASKPTDRQKLWQNAEVEFSNAVNLDPDYFDAFMNRGVLYIAMGKPNKAEIDLKRALELRPKSAEVFYNLACLYAVTGKLDLAIDSLDSALANGFSEVDRLRGDPDLNPLRGMKEFREVLDRHKFFIS